MKQRERERERERGRERGSARRMELITDEEVLICRTIIYNKPTGCISGSIVFINNYKYALHQRFSNFFQVVTTFISQNVLRTTLLLGLSNSLGLP